MTVDVASELAELRRDIRMRREFIEDQEDLIRVLKNDGHNVLEQEANLKGERKRLALRIAEEMKLMYVDGPHEMERNG